MEFEFLGDWLESDSGEAVHLAVFIALILGGFGFPIPEDIPLLLAGVAAGKDIVHLQRIWLTAYVGVICADLILYWAGYFFGTRLLDAGKKTRWFPSVTEERLSEIREGLRRRRLAIIFIGRHLFPVRSVTFLSAGALRVPFLEFLIADGFAALVSVTLVLGIGYFLGESLDTEFARHILHDAHIYLTIILVAGLLYWMWKRKTASNKKSD